jgi:hypothetical protein
MVQAAVYAGELIRQGAIGRVIQTINIAPHQIFQKRGDAGGSGGRPDRFWNPEQCGSTGLLPTHTAQDQEQCLLAAELVIKAQKNAKWVTLKD